MVNGYIKEKSDFDKQSTESIVKSLKSMYPKADDKQVLSWKNLVDVIKQSEEFAKLPNDCVISIEYSLPTDNMAIDLLISLKNQCGEKYAFIIEAKQWGDVYTHKKFLNKRSYKDNEEYHPQIQVSRYVMSFRDYLDCGNTYNIKPFVYIQHASQDGIREIIDKNPDKTTNWIPCYNSIDKIIRKIKELTQKNPKSILKEIMDAEYKPSSAVIDAMQSIITKEDAYILTEEQEKVVKKVKEELDKGTKIIRISGAAGSGKTAILLNLYLEYLRKTQNTDESTFFTPGNQNTHMYKSLYPEIDELFQFSSSLKSIKKRKKTYVFMDEAQRNYKGTINAVLDRNAQFVICYDEHQSLYADDNLDDLKNLETREDFISIKLTDSVRYNGSDNVEQNIENLLTLGEIHLKSDNKYELKIFSDIYEFQNAIISKIEKNPDSTFAVAGLLCEHADKYTSKENENLYFYQNWGDNYEKIWVPYVNNKNYFEKGKNIWVGTWWMPGLDFDYVAIIVGDDAILTKDGIKGCFEKSKLYDTRISIANKYFPDLVVKKSNGVINKEKTLIKISDYMNMKKNKEDRQQYEKAFNKKLLNAYYLMLTRGRKGCFVYFANNEIM